MILADRTVTIAEWDWVYTPEDDFAFLHHADRLDHPHEDWVSGSGRTSCIGMSPQRYLAHTPDWLVRKLAEQVRTRRNIDDGP